MNMIFAVNQNCAILTHFENSDRQEWIRIPDEYKGFPVAGIGPYAFCGDEHLKCVVIPMSIASIGQNAFKNCRSLQCVGVGAPSATGEIPLHSVFPGALNAIDAEAFANTSLVNLTFTGNVSIGSRCFAGCEKLKDVVFHRCSGFLEPGAFSGSGIEIFYMPEAKAGMPLPEECFSQCKKLRYVEIPSPAYIGAQCFAGCRKLNKLTFSLKTPISIGPGAFEGCRQLEPCKLYRTVSDVLLSLGKDAIEETMDKFKKKYDDLGLGDITILVHETYKLLDKLSHVPPTQRDTVLVSYTGVGYTGHGNQESPYRYALYHKQNILSYFQETSCWHQEQQNAGLPDEDALVHRLMGLPCGQPWDWDDREAIFCSLAVGTAFLETPRQMAVDLLFNYLDYHLIEDDSDCESC